MKDQSWARLTVLLVPMLFFNAVSATNGNTFTVSDMVQSGSTQQPDYVDSTEKKWDPVRFSGEYFNPLFSIGIGSDHPSYFAPTFGLKLGPVISTVGVFFTEFEFSFTTNATLYSPKFGFQTYSYNRIGLCYTYYLGNTDFSGFMLDYGIFHIQRRNSVHLRAGMGLTSDNDSPIPMFSISANLYLNRLPDRN